MYNGKFDFAKRSAKRNQTTLEDSKQSLIVNRCVSII